MRYLPFDQEKHFGPRPWSWSTDDEVLRAWEAGHGHDVRLKCYVEYSCQAIENYVELLEEAVARVRALCAERQVPGADSMVDVGEIWPSEVLSALGDVQNT